jgi:hypothetical protein
MQTGVFLRDTNLVEGDLKYPNDVNVVWLKCFGLSSDGRWALFLPIEHPNFYSSTISIKRSKLKELGYNAWLWEEVCFILPKGGWTYELAKGSTLSCARRNKH